MNNTQINSTHPAGFKGISPIWFVVIFFMALLISCKPEPMDLKLPIEASKPVVSCQYTRFEGASVLALVLSSSFDPFSEPVKVDSLGFEVDSSLLLRGAEVWIDGPGVRKNLEELDPGIYGSESIDLADGLEYTLTVSHENKFLKAIATKMKKVEMDSFSVVPDTERKNLQLFIRFNDILGSGNYYVINYTGSRKEPLPEKPDADYIAKRILEQNAGFDLLTDAGIDGQTINFSKSIPIPTSSDTFAMALTHISKGYYEFLSAQKKSGTLFNQLRAEVINFPGNIQGGYGYFELNEPDLKVVELR